MRDMHTYYYVYYINYVFKVQVLSNYKFLFLYIAEYRADEGSYNIFEPNSQNLDQYKDYEARDTLKTIEFTESSTQTYSNAEENIKKMEFANNAFGTFVGLELANVPVLKRRYVMYQIIKIIENNS